ncbi:hypothetical protein GGR57DRAFT_511307 [Xylariaceae sp. FL1272]|nr:hypothetical protein GGR57DRAFT_511307 [Xylariaceae sp. FL1272]
MSTMLSPELFYHIAQYEAIRHTNPGLSECEISCVLTEEWRRMTPWEKEPYCDEYEAVMGAASAQPAIQERGHVSRSPADHGPPNNPRSGQQSTTLNRSRPEMPNSHSQPAFDQANMSSLLSQTPNSTSRETMTLHYPRATVSHHSRHVPSPANAPTSLSGSQRLFAALRAANAPLRERLNQEEGKE